MNYVKHLSIAVLVLGTASVFAAAPAPAKPAKKVIGFTTPKGTALVLSADKKSWTLTGIGTKGDAREEYVLGGSLDKPTLVDKDGNDIALTDVFEKDGIVETVKTYFKDYVGENGTWKSRTAVIAPTAVVLGAIAYKTVPAFKDAADNAIEAGQNFVTDVKDNNGNARRNAAIGATALLGGGVAAFYYKNQRLPFCKAA